MLIFPAFPGVPPIVAAVPELVAEMIPPFSKTEISRLNGDITASAKAGRSAKNSASWIVAKWGYRDTWRENSRDGERVSIDYYVATSNQKRMPRCC